MMSKRILLLFCWIAGILHAQEIPQLESYTLKNGLKVYLMQYGKIPAVNVRFIVNTGVKNEAPGQQGYCHLVANLILEGNGKYTQEQQDDIMFSLGGTLNASDDEDYTIISADILSKDFDKAMDVYSAAIQQPLFEKEKMDREISSLQDYNTIGKMDIADLAGVYSDVMLFGTSNPLGRFYYKSQLQQISPEKIKEFYLFNCTPKNSSIVLCGNFHSDEIKKVIEKYFGSWTSTYGEANGVSLPAPQVKKKETGFINRTGATQCALQWNKTAPSVKDKDYLSFYVANRVFGTYLFSEIREKGGKTYSIGSRYHHSLFSNTYEVSCSVRNNEMLNTVNLFDKTLQNFNTEPLTQESFDKAVTAIRIGVISAEMPGDISSVYNPVVYNFDKRKNFLTDLQTLKMEEVQKAIKKYFTPNSYKLLIAGDEASVIQQLSALNGLKHYTAADIEKDN